MDQTNNRFYREPQADNVTTLPQRHPLVKRHSTTPEEMRAMVRDLALWMCECGVEEMHISREPFTANVTVTVDDAALASRPQEET